MKVNMPLLKLRQNVDKKEESQNVRVKKGGVALSALLVNLAVNDMPEVEKIARL